MEILINELFSPTSPYPPFTFDLSFNIEKTEQLFSNILEIYKAGCIKQFGKNGSFDLRELNESRILHMKECMKAIGILPKLYIYNNKEVHNLFLEFKEEVDLETSIQKIPFIKREIILQRYNIRYIKWYISNDKHEHILKEIKQKSIHYENIILLKYKEPEKTKLFEYFYRIVFPDCICVLRFDFL